MSASQLHRAYHKERSIAKSMRLSEYPCACSDCRGAQVHSVRVVAQHHRENKRDPHLTQSLLRLPRRLREDLEEVEFELTDDDSDDDGFDHQRMVEEAFARGDDIHLEQQQEDNVIEPDENDGCKTTEEMEELFAESRKRLFRGCRTNRLKFVIVMLTMCNLYGVSYSFLDELLRFLWSDILPRHNRLPKTSYECRSLLMRLGLKHEDIPCCPDGHILFWKQNKHLDKCPHPGCGKSKFMAGSSTTPTMVVRYFSIIKRFQRLFRCPEIAKLLQHHVEYQSETSVMRSVVDSPIWRWISSRWSEYAADPRFLRLALCLDGINPFNMQSTTYSTWHVLLIAYNLPPWLVTRKFFVSLVLLIPGPKSPTSNTIDVFLEPIIDNLLQLWNGVKAVDFTIPNEPRSFYLRAILMWIVGDYPALGLISGQVTKGYSGCLHCGEQTCGESCRPAINKVVYLGARRNLEANHPWRRARKAFNNEVEDRGECRRMTGTEVREYAEERQKWLDEGGRPNTENDPVKRHGVKRLSILYRLPYWEEMPVRYVLDVMHCEKNLADSLLRMLFGEIDTPAVRMDLENRRIRRNLWLRRTGDSGRLYMPDAPYVLSTPQRHAVLETLRRLKMPSRYCSNLHSKLSQGKLRGLKSHDLHVLLQQVLPLCLRGVGDAKVVGLIMRISRLFRKICAKSVDADMEEQTIRDVTEIQCTMEKEFPPAFFNITFHQPRHLVQDLFLCGPVHTRWMYPFERWLKGLKGSVRNRAKPEGSMAKAYSIEEASGFLTEYMSEYKGTSRRVRDNSEDKFMLEDVLEGEPKERPLSENERHWMHSFVLDNATHLEPWRRRYQTAVEKRTSDQKLWRRQHRRRKNKKRRSTLPTELADLPRFSDWLREDVDHLEESGIRLDPLVVESSRLPLSMASRYRSMYSQGNHFRVASAEESLPTYDSGICATFKRPCINGIRDKNPVVADLEYVGELKEIVELHYPGHYESESPSARGSEPLEDRGHKAVLFVGSWIKANYRGPHATIKSDQWGFTLANFDTLSGLGPESFAFPIQCEQVFYADAAEDSRWKVVLRKEARSKRVSIDNDANTTAGIFQLGSDNDYDAIVPERFLPEEDPVELPTGRNVMPNEVLFAEQVLEEISTDDALRNSTDEIEE